ncbi:hypothetical protein [Lentibacillus juripiscarius]|uniref:DUF4025 domain-containing protein n=1 Tax=Lentibacillus juripiscarius TaxID=257446 RepID=A0ABW5V1Q9_9BACI
MDKKKNKRINSDVVAPGIDPDDSYGKHASKAEIEKGESTKVTRLTYDEYDPSGDEGGGVDGDY